MKAKVFFILFLLICLMLNNFIFAADIKSDDKYIVTCDVNKNEDGTVDINVKTTLKVTGYIIATNYGIPTMVNRECEYEIDGEFRIIEIKNFTWSEATNNIIQLELYANDEKQTIILNSSDINKINIEKSINDFIDDMSKEEKNSYDGIDKISLFSEDLIMQSATKEINSQEIIIDDSTINDLVEQVNASSKEVDKVFGNANINKVRNIKKTARITTIRSGKITIKKDKINKNIDNIKIETPYGGISIPANEDITLSVENNSDFYIDFGKEQLTTKVTVSLPINENTDKLAIAKMNKTVNEDGSVGYIPYSINNGVFINHDIVVGGKYNPITDELTAKIDKSGFYSIIENEKSFNDIKEKSAEMQEAIKLLASKGIINGTSETEFSPDKSISRAEVAAIILRTLSKLDENADGGFSDVTKSNWFYGTAGSAKNAGIINGYEDNTFRGNVVIPKVQIVSVSGRVLKNEMGYYDVSDIEKALGGYGDRSDIAKWAEGDVALATDANMVIKRTDGLFGGTAEMTRGDAAIILKRLFDKVW